MTFILKALPIFILLALNSQTAMADMQSNDKMVNKWNQFVNDLLTLTHQLRARSPHTETKRTGGYSNLPAFYQETKYTNNDNNTVTSIVQMETTNPDAIHSIEVFLYDNKDRVIQDFSGSYLTTHRNAPIQTLITLHYYNLGLHGFRVFDASHERIYEVCRGQLNGKKVNIDIDDDYGELSAALEDKKGIMSTKEYLACFGSRDYDKKRLNIPLD